MGFALPDLECQMMNLLKQILHIGIFIRKFRRYVNILQEMLEHANRDSNKALYPDTRSHKGSDIVIGLARTASSTSGTFYVINTDLNTSPCLNWMLIFDSTLIDDGKKKLDKSRVVEAIWNIPIPSK
ncbi:hypothetical protein CHS0354_015789 [Potamilus streckersoni]|uniref:Uncharacterized protein n=1 Tax=Potamilus streckersoni TaxID=2493646 RepID=A0AAE0RQC9_9BIVA|nr:hypothetical protein CHS0354_015789 [Potamilus streckersoni]